LAIIGQEKEGVSFIPQMIDEFNCSGYGLAAFVNNPVHINQKAFLFHSCIFLSLTMASENQDGRQIDDRQAA
jgi:hypothetical protein